MFILYCIRFNGYGEPLIMNLADAERELAANPPPSFGFCDFIIYDASSSWS
jgi:hypothetical protein